MLIINQVLIITNHRNNATSEKDKDCFKSYILSIYLPKWSDWVSEWVEREREREQTRKVKPYIGNVGDTPCIGHVCPCDTFCILNLGIDQIKQNAYIWSLSVRIKFLESYVSTRKKNFNTPKKTSSDIFPHRMNPFLEQ